MWENDSMERIDLLDLLSNGPESWRLAADALARGAKFDLMDDGSADIGSIRAIFSRRQKLTARVGQPSVGFEEAVHALCAWNESEILLGEVNDWPQGGYKFPLFVSVDLAQVVACFGIKPPYTREPAHDCER
jgi:hypothetical protein